MDVGMITQVARPGLEHGQEADLGAEIFVVAGDVPQNPGVLQVRRFREGKEFIGDAIYDETRPLPGSITVVDPIDATRRKHFSAKTKYEDLLVPVLRHGRAVYDLPSLDSIRARAQKQLSMLHAGIKRFDNPHKYPAGLELTLHQFKTELILRAKGEI
jgi:nicotinate phosphoribosyltransferase